MYIPQAIETDTLVFQSPSHTSSHEVSSAVLTKTSAETPQTCKDNDAGVLFFKPAIDRHSAAAPSSSSISPDHHPSPLEENRRSWEGKNTDDKVSERGLHHRSEVIDVMKSSCGSSSSRRTPDEKEGKISQNKVDEKDIESDNEAERSVDDDGDRDEARIERRRGDLRELCRALLQKDPEARPTALE